MTPVSAPFKTVTQSLLAFGVALKRHRRAARLTQAQLAERAGFSVVYISMLERGARQPQPSTVALLVEALDLADPYRVALEGAAQLAAEGLASQRLLRTGTDGAVATPIGVFLGALLIKRLSEGLNCKYIERDLAMRNNFTGPAYP